MLIKHNLKKSEKSHLFINFNTIFDEISTNSSHYKPCGLTVGLNEDHELYGIGYGYT